MMPPPELQYVPRPEFDRVVDLLVKSVDSARVDLKETLSTGFRDVNDRLDTMNGTQRTHGERLVALEARSGRVDTITVLAVLSLLVSAVAAYAAFQH